MQFFDWESKGCHNCIKFANLARCDNSRVRGITCSKGPFCCGFVSGLVSQEVLALFSSTSSEKVTCRLFDRSGARSSGEREGVVEPGAPCSTSRCVLNAAREAIIVLLLHSFLTSFANPSLASEWWL
jgi:hypothetical protein